MYGLFLAGIERFKDIGISNDGKIEVVKQDDSLVVFEPQKYYLGIGDIDNEVMDAVNELSQTVKIYSFADTLKNDICMNMLGLSYDQCYGSEEDKNSPTHIKWENMAGSHKKKGDMASREIMEYVGTDIFRKLNENCHKDGALKKIKRESPRFALITDTRFANEVYGVKENNGIVIRLTRNPIDSSSKPEVALDKDNFDWSKFDHVIDNATCTIAEQCDLLYPIILAEVQNS